jgi:hypothetical protein
MNIDPRIPILDQAALGTLPARIDSDAVVSRRLIADLVATGHLSSVEAAGGGEPVFIDVAITPAGRRLLRELRQSDPRAAGAMRRRRFALVGNLLVYLAVMLVLTSLFAFALRAIAERIG